MRCGHDTSGLDAAGGGRFFVNMDLSHVRFRGTRGKRTPTSTPPPGIATAPPGGTPRPLELPESIGGLAASVLAGAGLDPAVYRPRPLERRLGACLRALRVGSEAEGHARLTAEPGWHAAALDALLIGVSDFFRDPDVFDHLARVVVPALATRTGSIRAWSVGCSNGAEVYSLAVLLGEAGLLERSWLLGTDCRREAIAAATAGVFPDHALGALSLPLRARYLDRDAGGWRFAEHVRRRIDWQSADCTRDLADGPWDLVLCRNLLMYLHPHAADRVVRGLVERLARGGFLVFGKAERPPATLGLVAVDRCIYRVNADV
jgi:chemotaxis methyl-accepting protein methylase